MEVAAGLRICGPILLLLIFFFLILGVFSFTQAGSDFYYQTSPHFVEIKTLKPFSNYHSLVSWSTS